MISQVAKIRWCISWYQFEFHALRTLSVSTEKLKSEDCGSHASDLALLIYLSELLSGKTPPLIEIEIYVYLQENI